MPDAEMVPMVGSDEAHASPDESIGVPARSVIAAESWIWLPTTTAPAGDETLTKALCA
jgi:hypothetical protein